MQIDNKKYLETIAEIQRKYPYDTLPVMAKEKFINEILLRLSWNTNALEGNTLTLEETVDGILYDEVRSGHTFSEYREAKSAYRAFSELLSFDGKRETDLDFIRRGNALIMDSDGAFRDHQVYIGTLAEVAYTPDRPENIAADMNQFISELKATERDLARTPGVIAVVVRRIAEFHIRFEMIHPFADGNGRTGRLIMDQLLLNAELLPSVITNQSRYRQAFRIYERNGGTDLMEHAILSGVTKSYEVLEQVCKALEIRGFS